MPSLFPLPTGEGHGCNPAAWSYAVHPRVFVTTILADSRKARLYEHEAHALAWEVGGDVSELLLMQ